MIKRLKKLDFGMAFMFSAVVFGIIASTFIINGFIMGILYHLGRFRPDPFSLLLQLAVCSILIGTMLSAGVSRTVLAPFRRLEKGMHQLAGGDFSVRINLARKRHPKEFHNYTDSFNHMAQELANTEILRTDFINNFSHEFKTPISSIKGFAELLRGGQLSPEQQEEYLDIIIQESRRLSQLSMNVLQLSKIEKQTILSSCETFDLTERLRHALVILEPYWAERNITPDIELDEIQFWGDPALFEQMVLNVVGNAIKFSRPDSRLEIGLVDFCGSAVLKVKDYGCGMDEDTKRHIYDKFYQGDTSHAVQGNGLGMSIVKRIVDLFEGQISVESRQGLGTEVTIALPCRQPPGDAGEAPLSQ